MRNQFAPRIRFSHPEAEINPEMLSLRLENWRKAAALLVDFSKRSIPPWPWEEGIGLPTARDSSHV